jgi:hypothetical protein
MNDLKMKLYVLPHNYLLTLRNNLCAGTQNTIRGQYTVFHWNNRSVLNITTLRTVLLQGKPVCFVI